MNKLFKKLLGITLGLSMAIGVGVAVGGNKDVVRNDAEAETIPTWSSGTPAYGSSYASGTQTLNGISWFVSCAGNNTSLGWNTTTQGGNNDASKAPLSTISQTTKYGTYQTSGGWKAEKIVVSLSNADSVTGTWYIWYSTNSGTSWTQATTGSLTSSTTSISYDHGSNIGDSVRFAFGFGTTKTTKTRINISNIQVYAAKAAVTYTVTVNVNDSSRGEVSQSSVTNVADNTSISASGATLTVGATSVTASPKTSTDQYDFAFSNWEGIPDGGKVTENITVTANFSATTRTYSVTNNVTYSNFSGASTVTYGTAYSGIFTAQSGYILPTTLDSVTIKGVASNNYSYNSSTGEFSIAAQYVTGAIAINGACEEASEDPVGISYSLSYCTIPDKPSQMYPSQEIVLTIVPDDRYKLPTEEQNKVDVIGASDWFYDDETGKIMIDGAADDVSVSVECVAKAQNTISMGTLTGVSAAGGNPTEVEESSTVTLTFTANSGYGLPTSSGITVTGTGVSFTWTQESGELQITGGTGNITVSIIGILKDLSSITLGSKITSYSLGDSFVMPTVTANFTVGASQTVTTEAIPSGVVENGVVTGSGTVVISYTYEPTGTTQTASYTVTATPIVPSTEKFVKVTSGTVTSGKYLIVNETASVAFNGGINSTSYDATSNIVSVSIDNNEIAYSAEMDAASFTYDSSAGTLKSAAGYYIYRNGTSTGITAQTDVPSLTTSITISNGNAVISNVKDSSTMRLRYNNASGQDRFRYYNSDSVQAIQIYKYQEAAVKELKWITAEVKSGTYYKGNSVTASDFTVTGHYNDGTTSTISSDITVTGGYLANVGPNTVTLTYSGLSCAATVTVVQAPVSSVELDVTSAYIGLDESYYLSDISVTINPSIAIQDYTWSLFNAGGLVENADYTFDGDEYHSINPGIVVFRCTSDADTSKYADFTLNITDVSEASFEKESTSGYAGKSETVAFAYANIAYIEDIDIVSDDESVATIGTIEGNNGNGTVVINFVGSGSTTVTMLGGIFTLDTLTVSVEADSVVSVTWSATDIDVWSGATLNTAGWNVQYTMASGDHGSADSYTIKLGDATVTAGYEFVAADDGKKLHVEYGGVSSSTITVTVTQTINAVYEPNTVTNSVSWTASEAANLGSKISSQGGTDTGTISTGDYSWNYTRTLTSLASGKSDNISFQGETWIQLGSNNAMESLELTTSAIPGTIKSVTVVAATAGSHKLTIDVGGIKYLENANLNVYSGTAGATNPDPTSADCIKTGTGTSSGTITISIAPTESTNKAMVIRSISVTYETPSGEPVNIANSIEHKAAQRAVVKYAKAFNAAMSAENVCDGTFANLTTGWSNAKAAYQTFLSDISGFSSDEQAYAKNLIKYATAQWSDNSDEACVERMMKTYEYCLSHYKSLNLEAFMSDIKTAPSNYSVYSIVNVSHNTAAPMILIVVGVITLTAVGGYYYLQKQKGKKKEN